jgi:hypothetical protein
MRMRARLYRVSLTVIALAAGSAVSGAGMGPAAGNPNLQGSVASCAGLLANNPTGQLAKGTMTALIDGAPWTAVCIAVNIGAPGIIGLGGSDNLSTPTTFGFGFTTSTRSHVAGTFSFTLLPGTLAPLGGQGTIKANTARGTRVVTNGAFDMTF